MKKEIKKLYKTIPIDYKEKSILIETKYFFKDEEKQIAKHKSYEHIFLILGI